MTKADLTRVSRAADKAARAREELEAAIRQAATRNSVREIATAAGLSKSRVHQIASKS